MRKNILCKIGQGKLSPERGGNGNNRNNKITKITIVMLNMQVLLSIGIAMKPLFMVNRVNLLYDGGKKKNRKKENRKERFQSAKHVTNVTNFI